MVHTHPHSREEGMAAPFPPQEAEKIWHGPSDPQKVLQLHHQEIILTGCIIAWYGKCYKGWWGQPSTSLGLSSLPPRTYISGGVKGRPKQLPPKFLFPSHKFAN